MLSHDEAPTYLWEMVAYKQVKLNEIIGKKTLLMER